MACVASPVVGSDGQVVAGISVSEAAQPDQSRPIGSRGTYCSAWSFASAGGPLENHPATACKVRVSISVCSVGGIGVVSARETSAAAAMTRSTELVLRQHESARRGGDGIIAATTTPIQPRIGAATQCTSAMASPLSNAQPWLSTDVSSRLSTAGLVTGSPESIDAVAEWPADVRPRPDCNGPTGLCPQHCSARRGERRCARRSQ